MIFIMIKISAILPEIPIDPMKVIEEAVLEFTDKKELLMAYMSSMIVGKNHLKFTMKQFNQCQKSRVVRTPLFLKD